MPRRTGDNSQARSECLRAEINEIAEGMIALATMVTQAAQAPEEVR